MAQRSWISKLWTIAVISWGFLASIVLIRNMDEPTVDFNKLVQWANSIEALQKSDEMRNQYLWADIHNAEDIHSVREAVYKFINHPMQGVCKVGKYFGGVWLGGYGCLDGHKFVCLDNLYEDVLKNECLIYSFGINNEWSFEENMISMGCTIRSFDPTIDGSSKPETDLVTFQKIGLADQSRLDSIGELVTLSEAVRRMGDSGRKISYLKVDIEGAELAAMKTWITSGILEYVSQIGIEIHSAHSLESGNATLFGLLETFRLFDKEGFKLISTTNNECVGKSSDLNQQYYVLFELVFFKQEP